MDRLDFETKVAVSLVCHVLQLFDKDLNFPSPHHNSVGDLQVELLSVLVPLNEN